MIITREAPILNQLLLYRRWAHNFFLFDSFLTEIVTDNSTFLFYLLFLSFPDNLLPNPRVLALVLFSVANVLSFARIAYILPASETFGQLQISYGRMLQDVFKFICIYFTVMIAFICGLTSLYSYSGESNFKEWVLLSIFAFCCFLFLFYFVLLVFFLSLTWTFLTAYEKRILYQNFIIFAFCFCFLFLYSWREPF